MVLPRSLAALRPAGSLPCWVLPSQAEALADHLLDRVMDLIGIVLHILQKFAEDLVVRFLAAMEHGENVVHKVQQPTDLLVLLMEAIKNLRHGS